MILIVTIEDDIHALAIQQVVKNRGYDQCYVLECDRLSETHRMRWDGDGSGCSGWIYLPSGDEIDVAEADIVWWRRARADQKSERIATDENEKRLVDNDCRGALNGILASCFRGQWISTPQATDRASDKLYQLSVASTCGFRIPRTLVSQSLDEVQEFVETSNFRVIVKPVVGTAGPLMFTQFMDDPSRLDRESFRVSPAIYQEYIEGTEHMRLNCFGNASFAALVQSNDLDWRANLRIPIREWAVPDDLHARVRSVLDALGLEMGIIDLKRTREGELVWLEVNPQGQFLFLEGLAHMPLSQHFASYLIDVADARHARRPGEGSAVQPPPELLG